MKRKKNGLFFNLAFNGIKNNHKLYTPYILAAAGITAMLYIIKAINVSELLNYMKGGGILRTILALGVFVIAVFAAVFMAYTHSFLIKSRTREFGLYNVLGMSRFHIARIVAVETLISGAISITGGLAAGLLFEKMAELLLAKLLNVQTSYAMHIDVDSLLWTAGTLAVIFICLMFGNMIRIFGMKTIDLLKSENVGEKPPKGNVFYTIIGFVVLGCAYYMAVSITNPVKAMATFFVAVIMVIAATYIIFVTGSVTICRMLQKKKGYYYQPKHFVSLSSMVFRMKRNGAGLSVICILSTMVLVMIASTSCLYFGGNATINNLYPREMSFRINTSREEEAAEQVETLKQHIISAAKDCGATLSNAVEFSMLAESAVLKNGVADYTISAYLSTSMTDDSWDLYMVSVDDYNKYMGTDLKLADDETICCEYDTKYPYDTFSISGGNEYRIADRSKDFYMPEGIATDIIPGAVFVVNRLPDKIPGDEYKEYSLNNTVFTFAFDINETPERQIEVFDYIGAKIFASDMGSESDRSQINFYTSECREDIRNEFYELYGGLFFLGMVLSLVFTFALVLIIYYKQISEGFEDRARFEIMRKVGMTKEEIKRSVNSQMGSVFFIPLAAAVMHLGFAFPMIYRMLRLFGLKNLWMLVGTAVISVLIFAVIYTIVYKITSNKYYSLVSC